MTLILLVCFYFPNKYKTNQYYRRHDGELAMQTLPIKNLYSILIVTVIMNDILEKIAINVNFILYCRCLKESILVTYDGAVFVN